MYNYSQFSPFSGQGFPGFSVYPGFPGFQSLPFQPGSEQGEISMSGPPTSPPPSTVPQQQQQVSTYAVDPGGIRGCLFRFAYVRLRGLSSFWFYPTFVGRNSIAGYRWTGNRWVYYGVDLDRIQSFQCV